MKPQLATVFSAIVLCATLPVSGTASAAMERIAKRCEASPCFDWLPILEPPSGWKYDRKRSLDNGISIFVKADSDEVIPKTVIYAQALRKWQYSRPPNLKEFILRHHNIHRTENRRTSIRTASPLETADGKQVAIWMFVPSAGGRWVRVGYLEEKDFYIAFSISSESSDGLTSYEQSFEEFVRSYRE